MILQEGELILDWSCTIGKYEFGIKGNDYLLIFYLLF